MLSLWLAPIFHECATLQAERYPRERSGPMQSHQWRAPVGIALPQRCLVTRRAGSAVRCAKAAYPFGGLRGILRASLRAVAPSTLSGRRISVPTRIDRKAERAR